MSVITLNRLTSADRKAIIRSFEKAIVFADNKIFDLRFKKPAFVSKEGGQYFEKQIKELLNLYSLQPDHSGLYYLTKKFKGIKYLEFDIKNKINGFRLNFTYAYRSISHPQEILADFLESLVTEKLFNPQLAIPVYFDYLTKLVAAELLDVKKVNAIFANFVHTIFNQNEIEVNKLVQRIKDYLTWTVQVTKIKGQIFKFFDIVDNLVSGGIFEKEKGANFKKNFANYIEILFKKKDINVPA